MKQRLNYIDIAKGLGIILVVLSHIRNSDVVNYALSFYVTIFFFCSGYTTSYSPQGDPGMMAQFKRHAIKLLKPYVFFSILLVLISGEIYLQGLIGIVYSRYSLYPLSNPDIHHFLIYGNYPLWFLTCMIVAYLLFYVIVYNPKYRYYLVSLYLVLTIAMTQLPILLPWSIDTAFFMAIFMLAGMETRKRMPNLFQSKTIHPLVLFAIIIYVLLVPLCFDVNLSVREYGSSIAVCFVAGLTGSLMTVYAARLLENTFAGTMLQKIGQHSLTIFCIQIPFILWGKELFEHVFPQPQTQVQFIITVIFQTLFTLTAGYLLSVLLQKNERIKKIIF